MKIALYQMDIIPGKPQENFQKVEQWLQETVETHKVDAVVLPELWTTAYTLESLHELAEDENHDQVLSFLQELAKTYYILLFGGSYAVKTKRGVVNRAVVITRDGEIKGTYDKIHLVPMLHEPEYMVAGESLPQIIENGDMKAMVSICYDLRFPELFRPLAVNGANIIVVPAEWPASRSIHWESLLQARAIENQAFVIGCNRSGSYNGTEFAGCSLIIDPLGHIIRKGSSDKEETLFAEIDFQITADTRKTIPVFESRKPALYRA